MKTTKKTLVILLLFSSLINSTPSDILIKIDINGKDISQLAALPIRLNYRQDDMMIVTTTREAAVKLQGLGFQFELLDESAWGKNYYLLEPVPGREVTPPAKPIWQNEQGFIIGLSPQEKPVKGPFKVTPLSRDPLPLISPPVKHLSSSGFTQDPVIRSLVNRVSEGTLTAGLQRLQAFRTRFSGSDSVYAAGQWLYDKFQEFGYTDIVFDTLTIPVENKLQRNIIATKKGTLYPDSVIVIGGHYDSIVHDGNNPMIYAPGVDDDGTGTIAVLESARLLADIDLECTVKFACWAAEEQGLYGSTDWVARAYQGNMNIGLYINFDMIGNVNPGNPGTGLNIATDNVSRHFADLMQNLAYQYTSLTPRIITAGGGSDHVPFRQRGYYFIYGEEEDFSPNWHKISDTIENVSIPYFSQVVKTGLATLATVAGAPESIDDAYVTYSDFSIQDNIAGNDNGFIDPGETVKLTVNVKNIGSTPSENLSVQLESSDPMARIYKDTFSGIDLAIGQSVPVTYQLDISSNTPADHLFILKLIIRDDASHSWENFIHIKVEQPELYASSQQLFEIAGNGNQAADPGETCQLTVNLFNSGKRVARDISVILSTTDPDIQITKDTSVFPAIEKQTSGDNSLDPWILTISPSALPHRVEFHLNISEGAGYYTRSVPVYILLSQEPILLVADDGETDISSRYIAAAQEIGIQLVLWDNNTGESISREQLMNYKSVIWYCGSAGRNNLSSAEQELIGGYLDDGGNLLLSGEFIGYHLRNSPFYTDYLHAAFAGIQTQLFGLEHTDGNPVTDMDILLDADENIWPTEIDPIEPAFPVLHYKPGTGTGTIQSSGTAALGVQTDTYKLVYCSFKLETIIPPQSRSLFIQDVLEWFNGAPLDIRPLLGLNSTVIDDDSSQTGAGNGDGYANPGENLNIYLQIENTGDLAAEDVKICLSTTDTSVTVIDSTIVLDRIDVRSTVFTQEHLSVHVSPSVQHDHQVSFEVKMTDASGSVFTGRFFITIVYSYCVSGRITDAADGEGVPGIVLWRQVVSYLTGGNNNFGAKLADSSGFFTMALPQDDYILTAWAENYTQSAEIRVKLDGRQMLDFELYSPRISANDSLYVSVPAGEITQDTLFLINTNNGILEFFIYESGGAGTPLSNQPIDVSTVLKTMSVLLPHTEEATPVDRQPEPDDWKILYHQESVDGSLPALRNLYIHKNQSDLYFKHLITEADGDAIQYFLFFDTDFNSDTGLTVSDLGADYLFLYEGLSAYIVQWSPGHNEFRPISGYSQPRYMDWNSEEQMLLFGLRLEQIGNPHTLRMLCVLTDKESRIYDYAPRGEFISIPFTVSGSPWLSFDRYFDRTGSNPLVSIPVTFDASELQPGIYTTNISVQNNDPTNHSFTIPVTFRVGETGIQTPDTDGVPDRYALHQNYPNPFSSRLDGQTGTTVRYQLPIPEKVTIKVYNMLGQQVVTLVDARQPAGYHSIQWNGCLAGGKLGGNGIYFIRFQAGDYSETRKMLLVK
ncbi:M20/M25/M40 family metallo-hydrolase [candidate division KSB1 bacterium]|nr:M20/M25/M40 family metallo-hydrolase [candidate division KSB1 bacterium]